MDQSNSIQILNQDKVDMILKNGGSGGSADNETMLVEKLIIPILNQQNISNSAAGVRIQKQELKLNSPMIQQNENSFHQSYINGKYQTCKINDFNGENQQIGLNIDSLQVETTLNQQKEKAISEDDFLKQVNAESKEDFMNRMQEFENEESAAEDEQKQNCKKQRINTQIEFDNIMKDHANITTSSKSSKFTPNSKLGQSEFEFQDMIISENFISFFQQNHQNQLYDKQKLSKSPTKSKKQNIMQGNPTFMLNPLNFTQIQEKILMNDTISLSKIENTQNNDKSQSDFSQEQTQYKLFQNIIQHNMIMQDEQGTPSKQQNQYISNNYDLHFPENLNQTQSTVNVQMPAKVKNQSDFQNAINRNLQITQIVDENINYNNTFLNKSNLIQSNSFKNNQTFNDSQDQLSKSQKNYQSQFIAKTKKNEMNQTLTDDTFIQNYIIDQSHQENILNDIDQIKNQTQSMYQDQNIEKDNKILFLECSLQEQTMKKQSELAVECILEQTAELKKILNSNNNQIQESKIKLLQDAIQQQIDRIQQEDQQITHLINQSQSNINLYSEKIKSIQEMLQQVQNKQLQSINLKINHLNQNINQIYNQDQEEINLQNSFSQLEDQINRLKQMKFFEMQKSQQLQNHIKMMEQTEKKEIRSSTETSLHFDVLKKLPLVQEMDVLSDQLKKYKEEQNKLYQQKHRNEERLMMLQEDFVMSKQQLMRQVIEREEFELQCGFLLSERGQQCTPEKQLIAQFMYQMKITPESRPEGMNQECKMQIFNYLIDNQKRQILMNLIRQLQQYLLSINSATTDSSMANSDNLDNLTLQIQNFKISIVHAIQQICNHTNSIMLQQRSCEQGNELNQQIIMSQLQDFEKHFDWKRAEILTQEVWKDMVYLQKLNKIIEQTSFKIKIQIEAQIDLVQKENMNIQQFQNSLSKQIVQIQERQKQIKIYIDSKQQESVQNSQVIQKLNIQINQLQIELQEQENKVQQINTQIEIQQNKQQYIQSKIEGILNNKEYQTEIIKKEIKLLQKEKSQLLNQELILEKEYNESIQLKQEAENLLKYSVNRKNELQESLLIARQAIDQSVDGTNINFNLHTADIQEEKNQKNENDNQSMLISQCVYGETQSSRISNIQDKSQNLIHGKILSPSSKKKKGQKINLNQIQDPRRNDSSCYDEDDNCAERAQISEHNLTEMSSVKGYQIYQSNQNQQIQNNQILSDYTDSNKLQDFQRKHDNLIIKQIIMNNSAKLSKQSCDTNNNPLDSNLQRSDFEIQKMHSNYQISRDHNQSMNFTDEIKIQNEILRKQMNKIEEQKQKREAENIKILLCSSAYNSVQKSIQPVSGQTTALNSCFQSQSSAKKDIDILKQFANQDLTLSMLVVDPNLQNNLHSDFQQTSHKIEQSNKVINLKDLAAQSLKNDKDQQRNQEKQKPKKISQDIYDPYDKMDEGSVNQYKQMNFIQSENENQLQQKLLSNEIQNLLNNEPIDPLLDQIHLQQMKIHNQIKQFQQNMNDHNSSEHNKSSESRKQQYKKHTFSSQMKVNFAKSDLQQNRSHSQKQKRKIVKNLTNQQIEMVNNKPYGNTFSGNNKTRLSSQNDILMQQLNNKSQYTVQNLLFNHQNDQQISYKQYQDQIDQNDHFKYLNEKKFEEQKQFQQNFGLNNSQLQNRLQFQNQSLQFSNFDSSYQGDKLFDSQLNINNNYGQRQPFIMSKIRNTSNHTDDSNQNVLDYNDQNMRFQNKAFRESQSSNLALNLKKIGHLSDVGQILTMDNINQKIHHFGLQQTQMNNCHRACSMQSKELKDLKIAYQIQCERQNKKKKTYDNRLRSGSSLNTKHLQAVTSQRKNHRSSSAISIYNSQHEGVQDAQKCQYISMKKFNQSSPKTGKQKMCSDNIFNQSTFNYQSQKFEDHQLNMKAQQVLGIIQLKKLQKNKSKDSSENFKEKLHVPQKTWIQQLRQSQTTPIIKLINQKSLKRKKSITNDQRNNNLSESVIKSDISGTMTQNRGYTNTSQIIRNGQNNSIEQLQNSIMRVQIDPHLPTNNNVTINTQSSLITQNTPSIFRNDNRQAASTNVRYINLNQSFQNASKTGNKIMANDIINSNKNSKADLLIQRLSQVYKMQKRSYSSQGCAQKDLLNQIQNEKMKKAKCNSHQRYNQHLTQIVKQQLPKQLSNQDVNLSLKRPKSTSGLNTNNKSNVPSAFANLVKFNQNSQMSLQNSQFQNYQTLEAPSSTFSQINQNLLNQANFQNTVTKSETQLQNENSKLVKIEFKRYEPIKNQIETYIARVPSSQDKIINFFTMITPLIEGCNFLDMSSRSNPEVNNRLKIELVPRCIDKLMIFKGSQPGILENTINVKNITNVKIPQNTLDEIRRYKQECGHIDNSQIEYIFSFYVLLQIPLQELDQDTTMMSGSRSDFNPINSSYLENDQSQKFKNMKLQLGTNNYMDLKRWVLGLNLLIQNQNTLNRLGKMMVLQK